MAFQSNKPIYLQIADGLMDHIQAGRYPADYRIPSVRETAADAQVNVNTAMRAYEQLERDGIIYNRRGIGYFTSPDAASRITARRAEEFFTGELDYLFSRLSQIGMNPSELQQRYESFLEQKAQCPSSDSSAPSY